MERAASVVGGWSDGGQFIRRSRQHLHSRSPLTRPPYMCKNVVLLTKIIKHLHKHCVCGLHRRIGHSLTYVYFLWTFKFHPCIIGIAGSTCVHIILSRLAWVFVKFLMCWMRTNLQDHVFDTPLRWAFAFLYRSHFGSSVNDRYRWHLNFVLAGSTLFDRTKLRCLVYGAFAQFWFGDFWQLTAEIIA